MVYSELRAGKLFRAILAGAAVPPEYIDTVELGLFPDDAFVPDEHYHAGGQYDGIYGPDYVQAPLHRGYLRPGLEIEGLVTGAYGLRHTAVHKHKCPFYACDCDGDEVAVQD